MKNLDFSKTIIKDGFWKYYYDLNRDVTAHAVYDRFEETGRFDAFKCRWIDGQENKPHYFWDSDIAKWMEGIAYLAEVERCPELEAKVDAVVEDIEANQLADGYFNSYFIGVEPSKKYQDRGKHELYCAGHLIEAAIAYDKATGKDKLLKCMLKNIDNIYQVFVVEQRAAFVTPGHEEIELALLNLYEYLGDPKHLELAEFFINLRGNNEKEQPERYNQSHLPVREQHEAVGHSVRACYLYTAMAHLARLRQDKQLKTACDNLFADIIHKKMSITGGVGSLKAGEQFSYAYDLPNHIVYNETCAAISLAMFASEMQQMENSTIYSDIIERIYYNGFISGLSLSGDRFFYTNPLEIDLKNIRNSEWRPISQRVKVFECSCCPPNVVRFLGALPRYMYATEGNTVFCNQFADAVTTLEQGTLTQKTDYPFSGKIEFAWQGSPITLKVRIPDWCVEYSGKTENGYAVLSLQDGDTVTVDLPMEVHIMQANPHVQDNAGRYAVMRGPIVYCLEGIDNGDDLRDIALVEASEIRVEREDLPAPVLYMSATRRKAFDALYALKSNERTSFTSRLIPYFAFANRGESDMIVWVQVQ